MSAKGAKYPAANHGADNPKDDIQKEALARAIDNLTANETRDQSQNHPCKK